MSARLNLNPIPDIKWKGNTFQQISAGIKYNKSTATVSGKTLFKAFPLKIHRKEIASVDLDRCNIRTSVKINDFDMPGGTLITSLETSKGLVNTEDINYENNSCQHPTSATDSARCEVFLSPEVNARRRVRSSGMIKRKFNTAANNDTYYTSSNQYLVSRNRSFLQNQYFHIREGDVTVKPGTNSSKQNIYSANGINHCSKFTFHNNVTYQYQWIDGSGSVGDGSGNYYDVTVPAGSYDIADFNTILHNAMYTNTHYYTALPQKNIVYLLNFAYDNDTQKLVIQAYYSDTDTYTTTNYDYPIVLTLTWATPDISTLGSRIPRIVIPSDSVLYKALGFDAGTYPTSTTLSTNQYIQGTGSPGIQPNYVPIYYKPSNPQFAQQGAVSSGDLITRKKYDAITKVGYSFRSAYGAETADAVAYGVPQYGYTKKDKEGYPVKKTPTFSKYSNIMKQCSLRKFSNQI